MQKQQRTKAGLKPPPIRSSASATQFCKDDKRKGYVK